ncbi:MAG: UDP-N-acetylmuramoyl-tripeptide--D-alanyl-D-alanine ligase [Anaerolineaceae bacterium]|nr:UDP-N-acetylmuramoyl-tripeptide--D-alanyl-D-alanine ligase [Anaerolineaceae bacterium]MDE0329991.1 UDP-N-acetylmuramoyl-tripeptide--D-alanyl-D-alanine ligase [Anaerolineaceae bacterium]
MILALAALVWLAGCCHRLYRQALYLQLEEYESGRYLRWLADRGSRWLPRRPLTAWLVGSALILLFAEAPDTQLPVFLSLPVAILANWPQKGGEVKKGFRVTWRVRRFLLVAWVLALLVALPLIAAIDGHGDGLLQPLLVTAAGLLLVLMVPVLLVGANLLLRPLESLLRRRFVARARAILMEAGPTIIGITGSYGKTSTKVYLQHILNGHCRVGATPKSFNTLMGVCLAISQDLEEDRSLDYYIVEMGAYVPGEIAEICELARPAISIVTAIGPQHLERFGSIDNIVSAKYEIISALPADGVAVLDRDNPHLRAMAARAHPATILTVSCEGSVEDSPADDPRLVATDIQESLDGLRFNVEDRRSGERVVFSTNLLGRHNVNNILLAAAVARNEGMSLRDIAWRVRSLQPAEARLAREETATGITLINDGYSANPAGARHALRVLGMHAGRRLLVTPGMVELGDLMECENRKLGAEAARQASDVILVGERQTRPLRQGLLEAGFAEGRLHTVNTLTEAITWYESHLVAGDAVLFLNDLPENWS